MGGTGIDGGAAAGHRDLLRAARRERGWSQGAAARELVALATRSGGPSATAGSLKTQLSRWENDHATPDPQYRALLAALYGRSEAELGLAPPATGPEGAGAADRFRAAVEAAGTLDPDAVALLHDQVRATAALDHRLGTAAAHATLAAQVEHLRTLLAHSVDPERGAALAAVLAEAALLAGDQERDLDAPDRAWSRYLLAGEAADRAGRAGAGDAARRRRVRLLREAGLDGAARALADTAPATGTPNPNPADGAGPGRAPVPDRQLPPVPASAGVTHDGPPIRDRLDDLVADALTARRDGRTGEATAAAAVARRTALRTGSARALGLLDGHPPGPVPTPVRGSHTGPDSV